MNDSSLIENNATMLSRTCVTIYFLHDRLFATVSVYFYAPFCDVKSIICAGIHLVRREGTALVIAGSQILRNLSTEEGDEFGLWPEEANRSDQEAYFAACTDLPTFEASLIEGHVVEAKSWSAVEFLADSRGHFAEVREVVSSDTYNTEAY